MVNGTRKVLPQPLTICYLTH